VSKNLTALIVGENAGSKLKKAEKLNESKQIIHILSENEFLEQLKLTTKP
jgi:NAD-dependent DNA ligase